MENGYQAPDKSNNTQKMRVDGVKQSVAFYSFSEKWCVMRRTKQVGMDSLADNGSFLVFLPLQQRGTKKHWKMQ